MSFSAERSELMKPLLDADLGVPILLPGVEQEPPQMSGDPEAPTRFVMFDATYPGSQYMAFDGGAHVTGLVDLTLMVEPIAGDAPMRALVDAIEAAYLAATPSADLHFRVQEAAPDVFGDDGGFLRWDYRIPFWRFT